MTTRALIADDEPHLARALQAELAALWPELQVVAVARNGVEAAERIAALQPELPTTNMPCRPSRPRRWTTCSSR